MNKLKNPRAAASQFYPLFARDLRSTSINCRFLSTKAMEKERFTELKGLDHPDRRTDLYHRLRIGPIKKLYKYITPTATSLAGGSPMDSTFPFSGVTVQLKEPGDQFSLENSKGLKLNYHRGDGIPPMKEWVVNHIKSVHNPPVEFDVCPTVGSTDALTKTMMLLKTDYVMFDQYAYGAAVNTCYVLGRKTAGVPVDEFGMIPDKLVESVLTLRQAGHTVNAVYLCPIGQNPMGFTMAENRKQELYKACQELDLVIIEDDAYYYLYFDLNSNEFVGTKQLPKSFLSMDTDKRVIRFDSVSKSLAPGVRIGWITTTPEFISKYILLQECSTQFPSGFSQSIFVSLMDHWGKDTFHTHIQSIQRHYRDQCRVMISALQEAFPKEICTFTVPMGGMFVFLYFPTIQMTSGQLFEVLAKSELICVPGDEFYVPDANLSLALETEEEGGGGAVEKPKLTPSLRLTYAAAKPDQIRKGIKMLSDCIHEILKNQSK